MRNDKSVTVTHTIGTAGILRLAGGEEFSRAVARMASGEFRKPFSLRSDWKAIKKRHSRTCFQRNVDKLGREALLCTLPVLLLYRELIF